jgi:hypothetical protein
VATAWVSGPRFSEAERKDHQLQCKLLGIAEQDSAADLGDEDETLEVAPENLTAFYWFVEVDTDGFWQYTQGQRYGLDIQTILLDANTTGREFEPGDYKKLKLLGRFAISAELKAQASKHGE